MHLILFSLQRGYKYLGCNNMLGVFLRILRVRGISES